MSPFCPPSAHHTSDHAISCPSIQTLLGLRLKGSCSTMSMVLSPVSLVLLLNCLPPMLAEPETLYCNLCYLLHPNYQNTLPQCTFLLLLLLLSLSSPVAPLCLLSCLACLWILSSQTTCSLQSCDSCSLNCTLRCILTGEHSNLDIAVLLSVPIAGRLRKFACSSVWAVKGHFIAFSSPELAI